MSDSRRQRKDVKHTRDSPSSKTRDRPEEREERRKSYRVRNGRSSRRDDRQTSPTLQESSSSSSTYAKPRRIGSTSVPELNRRSSSGLVLESRSSLPYPSFSKAHSREAVNSHENVARSLYTPEPTDLGQLHTNKSATRGKRAQTLHSHSAKIPPSPPLTSADRSVSNSQSNNGVNVKADQYNEEEIYRPRKASSARNSPFRTQRFSASRTSLKDAEEGRNTPKHMKDELGISKETSSPRPVRYPGVRSTTPISSNTGRTSSISQSNTIREAGTSRSQMIEVFTSTESQSDDNDFNSKDNSKPVPPPPPPPPPPLTKQMDTPKVDYLLQNGGLSQAVPKSFASVIQTSKLHSIHTSDPYKPLGIESVFQPCSQLLEDFDKVFSRGGSIAVATGYRSVARRLLDRLEAVFSRNISSEVCTCIICQTCRKESSYLDVETGVSWGEVLELVSGRRDLPTWPPFSISNSQGGLGTISESDQQIPMQKLDIDVPEEYRDHYIRQSKKTKQAVQNWLATQPEEDSHPPPAEVDDETLTFAMLTYLEPDERRIFTALRRGLEKMPETLVPTPSVPGGTQSDLMSKIGLSLQRLYRLPRLPRDPESCMYLLKNPTIHNALATLAAISNAEWDILISGRFDGFLWSGAEGSFSSVSDTFRPDMSLHMDPARTRKTSSSNPPHKSASTTNLGNTMQGSATPRSSTPRNTHSSMSSLGGPVQVDEETEMTVLAEIEREIFLGMEALEDAFELLHVKAQDVRRKMMERAAGLALSAKTRRRDAGLDDTNDNMVRLDTPAMGPNSPQVGTTDCFDDERSELAPDDSASNIGGRDHKHRHRRRRPRRTPAPVEEELEDY